MLRHGGGEIALTINDQMAARSVDSACQASSYR